MEFEEIRKELIKVALRSGLNVAFPGYDSEIEIDDDGNVEMKLKKPVKGR